MSKILDIDFRTGNYIERVNGISPTFFNPHILKQRNKGYGNSFLIYNGTLTYNGVIIDHSTDDFTYTLWINTCFTNSNSSETFFNFGNGTSLEGGLVATYYFGPKYLRINFNSYPSYINIYNIENGKDYFIVIKRENGIIYYKVNDNDFVTSITYQDSVGSAYPLRIGSGLAGLPRGNINSSLYKLTIYNNALSQQEINKQYKDFLNSSALAATKFNYLKAPDYENGDIMFYDDFRYEKADGQEQVPKDWLKGTGTFKFTELTADDPVLTHLKKGQKVLKCTTIGNILIPFKENIGVFEFDFNANFIIEFKPHGNLAEAYPKVVFKMNNGTLSAYYQTSSSSALLTYFSAGGFNYYVDRFYTLKIETRDNLGVIETSLYLKGADLGNNYILLSASVGTNPFTSNIIDSETISLDFSYGLATKIGIIKVANNN